MLGDEELKRVSNILSALGNPTRLRIVELVSEVKRPLHIKAVAKMLKKDYAAVYRHVKVLQRNDLLEVYEVGRSRVLYPKEAELTIQIIRSANKIIQKH